MHELQIKAAVTDARSDAEVKNQTEFATLMIQAY